MALENSVLLLVTSSPASPGSARALQLAGDLRRKGDAISLFLLQDAVYLTLTRAHGARKAVSDLLGLGVAIHILEEDLRLRGFDPVQLDRRVQVSGYPELVAEMMEKHARVMGAF